MKEILDSIYDRLKTIPGIGHIGEEQGQLYNITLSSFFPCILISIDAIEFGTLPGCRQTATIKLGITIADRSETHDIFGKKQPFTIYQLAEKVNNLLHGYETEKSGRLIRLRIEKNYREDRINEIKITYNSSYYDICGIPDNALFPTPTNINIES